MQVSITELQGLLAGAALAFIGDAVAQSTNSLTFAVSFVAVDHEYPWQQENPDGSFEEVTWPLLTLRIVQSGACKDKQLRVIFDEVLPENTESFVANLGERSAFSLRVAPWKLLLAEDEILQTSDSEVDVAFLLGGARPRVRTAVEDPAMLEHVADYAARLQAALDWPNLSDAEAYQAGPDYRIEFDTTIGPANVCGFTQRQAGAIQIAYREMGRDWNSTACSAGVLGPLSEEPVTASLTMLAGGRAVGGFIQICSDSER